MGHNLSVILLCRAMHAQLLAVRNLVQLLDPAMHSFMEEKSCLNYFFCYRWLLIHFKREFAFDEVGPIPVDSHNCDLPLKHVTHATYSARMFVQLCSLCYDLWLPSA